MKEKLILIDPLHMKLQGSGHGEFPDSYIVNEVGIEKIKEYLNKINSNE